MKPESPEPGVEAKLAVGVCRELLESAVASVMASLVG